MHTHTHTFAVRSDRAGAGCCPSSPGRNDRRRVFFNNDVVDPLDRDAGLAGLAAALACEDEAAAAAAESALRAALPDADADVDLDEAILQADRQVGTRSTGVLVSARRCRGVGGNRYYCID